MAATTHFDDTQANARFYAKFIKITESDYEEPDKPSLKRKRTPEQATQDKKAKLSHDDDPSEDAIHTIIQLRDTVQKQYRVIGRRNGELAACQHRNAKLLVENIAHNEIDTQAQSEIARLKHELAVSKAKSTRLESELLSQEKQALESSDASARDVQKELDARDRTIGDAMREGKALVVQRDQMTSEIAKLQEESSTERMSKENAQEEVRKVKEDAQKALAQQQGQLEYLRGENKRLQESEKRLTDKVNDLSFTETLIEEMNVANTKLIDEVAAIVDTVEKLRTWAYEESGEDAGECMADNNDTGEDIVRRQCNDIAGVLRFCWKENSDLTDDVRTAEQERKAAEELSALSQELVAETEQEAALKVQAAKEQLEMYGISTETGPDAKVTGLMTPTSMSSSFSSGFQSTFSKSTPPDGPGAMNTEAPPSTLEDAEGGSTTALPTPKSMASSASRAASTSKKTSQNPMRTMGNPQKRSRKTEAATSSKGRTGAKSAIAKKSVQRGPSPIEAKLEQLGEQLAQRPEMQGCSDPRAAKEAMAAVARFKKLKQWLHTYVPQINHMEAERDIYQQSIDKIQPWLDEKYVQRGERVQEIEGLQEKCLPVDFLADALQCKLQANEDDGPEDELDDDELDFEQVPGFE